MSKTAIADAVGISRFAVTRYLKGHIDAYEPGRIVETAPQGVKS